MQDLTTQLREHVELDDETLPFNNFVIYFACKNTKKNYMKGTVTTTPTMAPDSAFFEMSDNFLRRWNLAFDEQHLDPAHVYVDVGKQVTPQHSHLPYARGDPAGTFLWRKCCLASALYDRHQWLANTHARERAGKYYVTDPFRLILSPK